VLESVIKGAGKVYSGQWHHSAGGSIPTLILLNFSKKILSSVTAVAVRRRATMEKNRGGRKISENKG
jgi:hypothetical protein